MDHFELHSEYKPTGDQPQAIERLVRGFKEGNQFETLLGAARRHRLGQNLYHGERHRSAKQTNPHPRPQQNSRSTALRRDEGILPR